MKILLAHIVDLCILYKLSYVFLLRSIELKIRNYHFFQDDGKDALSKIQNKIVSHNKYYTRKFD